MANHLAYLLALGLFGLGRAMVFPKSFLSMFSSQPSAWSDLGQVESKNYGVYMCMDGDRHTYPKDGDRVKVHYTGKLMKDNFQFDSSRDKAPFEFTVGAQEVIAGWDDGLKKMSIGERAILQIPAPKGYGGEGAGGVIPPFADLYFDVELLAINGKTRQAPKKEKPGKKALPEQGYEGKPVEHKDMETCTKDWGVEYGPNQGKNGPCNEEKEAVEPGSPAPKKSASAGNSPMVALVVAITALVALK